MIDEHGIGKKAEKDEKAENQPTEELSIKAKSKSVKIYTIVKVTDEDKAHFFNFWNEIIDEIDQENKDKPLNDKDKPPLYYLNMNLFFFRDDPDDAKSKIVGEKKLLQEFGVKEFPFCLMIDHMGLIAWSGMPDHRDMKLDFQELLAERSLVDTEDWLDDPDEPQLDPDEVDPKSLPNKKIKTIKEVLNDQETKFQFFMDILTKEDRTAFRPTKEEEQYLIKNDEEEKKEDKKPEP